MKVVILCGGQGIRLRELTESLPKPLVTIGDRPMLWHIMKLYAHYGIKDFILCLGYKGWKIKDYFLNFRARTSDCTVTLGEPGAVTFHHDIGEADWNVTLVDTGEEEMTGARLWRVRKFLRQEKTFCLTYGDGLADIDVARSIAFHQTTGAVGMVMGVCPAGRYGELRIEGNLVTSFQEKPGVDEGWVNGGFMAFDATRIWNYLSPEKDLVLEKDVLPAMVLDRQLCVYKHEGFWMGLDTLREHTILNELWRKGEAPWKIWSSPNA